MAGNARTVVFGVIMDRERTDWSKAEEASQESSFFGVTVAADPTDESPRVCSRVWDMPVPDWKMRIYQLIFHF